jgi:uncharacterized protein
VLNKTETNRVNHSPQQDVGAIYIDLDDVLGETARMLMAVVESEFGKQVNYDDMSAFDLRIACDLNDEEAEVVLKIAHEPNNLLGISPKAGAQSALRQWVEAGHQIVIVTGRPPETRDVSVEWLQQNDLPHHEILLVDKYGRYEVHHSQTTTLDELRKRSFSLAVEDAPSMATWLAETAGFTVALLDCPWNRTLVSHPLIRRCSDWESVLDIIH